MAFTVGNRVVCIDQSSDFRTKIGTVLTVPTTGNNMVRFDGFPSSQPALMLDAQLGSTTLTDPLDYSDE